MYKWITFKKELVIVIEPKLQLYQYLIAIWMKVIVIVPKYF